VMRSLYATSEFLEREETLYFLQEDTKMLESNIFDSFSESNGLNNQSHLNISEDPSPIKFPSPTQNVGERYRNMQEVIRSQYLYQRGLLTEVILNILRDAGSRPILERADSTLIKNCLHTELANNGVDVPFVFGVYDVRGNIVYSADGFSNHNKKDCYSIPIFSNTDTYYMLTVYFPTKESYIFSSVRFIIPTLALTFMLLVVFLYTIIIAFRQKKITEMKTDFINNMTHELKTPISTISLAAQMLSDPSVLKSQGSLEHLSEVITDESKRLRFQVEKVLQMSVFDNAGGALKFTEVDANYVIQSVVNTFKIKVEKYGGTLTADLDADNAWVRVDKMQFTNVIFNLLDNAVKYMDSERKPLLKITTNNISDNKLKIEISDNGIGIKKDDLKRIFEKFYRVNTGNLHNVKGFGLGLAYVKKMITLFDGTITAESTFGEGSTFTIILPVLDEQIE
ncbi:MAG: HAMP domain-containing histidine kinase, partial [Roseburia sp.]|nr:HAMP domain-containing histidine kinase [Roseburia sp.]